MLIVPESSWECNDSKVYSELKVDEGNVISEDFIVKASNDAPAQIFGNLLVTWTRKEGVVNDCRIPIPVINSLYYPFDLIVNVGSEFYLGQVFEMTVKVKNKTKLEIEVRLALEESSAFLVGGVESFKFELPGENEKEFKYSLVGVEPGLLELPVITANIAEVKRTWQGKVFVLP